MSKNSTSKFHQTTGCLDKQDFKNLSKLASTMRNDIIDSAQDYYDSLFNGLFLNRCLLIAILEELGHNPIESCPQLRDYLIYHHSTMLSEVPGIYVWNGRLYEQDGTEIPSKYYDAKEKGLSFEDVMHDGFLEDTQDRREEDGQKIPTHEA